MSWLPFEDWQLLPAEIVHLGSEMHERKADGFFKKISAEGVSERNSLISGNVAVGDDTSFLQLTNIEDLWGEKHPLFNLHVHKYTDITNITRKTDAL